jgi:hypothetical protein
MRHNACNEQANGGREARGGATIQRKLTKDGIDNFLGMTNGRVSRKSTAGLTAPVRRSSFLRRYLLNSRRKRVEFAFTPDELVARLWYPVDGFP